MNLNNILKENTNYWYKNAFEVEHARKPVFLDVLSQLNSAATNILEIGATGGDMSDNNYIHGAGGSSFYFAEYVRQNGGSLTIVDLNPPTLENCKVMLGDFVKAGVDIRFVCDDGLAFLKQNNNFDFIYLDGPDQEVFTFECFRLINRTKTTVLIDDANGWNLGQGKCVRTRKYYDGYRLFKCGISHEMIIYDIIAGNNEKFKIGNLELDYYRGSQNMGFINERAVEVSLGKWFVEKFSGSNMVELGAVMPYYLQNVNHSIIDPYDLYSNCLKIDGAVFDYTNKNVLSISSLEHVGNDSNYDKYNEEDKAVKLLEKIVNTAQNYLICWGIGQHSKLDEYVRKSNLPTKIMVRDNPRGPTNNWHEDNNKNNLYLPYGSWDFEAGFYGNSLGEIIVSNVL